MLSQFVMSVIVLLCWSTNDAKAFIYFLKFVELASLNVWCISSVAIGLLIVNIVKVRPAYCHFFFFFCNSNSCSLIFLFSLFYFSPEIFFSMSFFFSSISCFFFTMFSNFSISHSYRLSRLFVLFMHQYSVSFSLLNISYTFSNFLSYFFHLGTFILDCRCCVFSLFL